MLNIKSHIYKTSVEENIVDNCVLFESFIYKTGVCSGTTTVVFGYKDCSNIDQTISITVACSSIAFTTKTLEEFAPCVKQGSVYRISGAYVPTINYGVSC